MLNAGPIILDFFSQIYSCALDAWRLYSASKLTDNKGMRNIILTITLFAATTLTSLAQTLEAKSVLALMEKIGSSSFSYKERGKIFGFNSIQSCLYVSEDIAIFKNYCFPVRKYPARGYTIISKEFGMIDLYEENLQGILKRDIQITQFPENLAPYLTTPFPQSSLEGLSAMMEKIYYNFNPGCWSTNYGWESGIPEATCSHGSTVMHFESWATETQEMVREDADWANLMDSIDVKIR